MSYLLTASEVREYLGDYPQNNLLLDTVEFGDTFIELCMELAVSEYNTMSPVSCMSLTTFPSKSLLLMGTCWQMYQGRAALMARNQLSYSDGGLQIPVEEKYELYMSLAANFKNIFQTSAMALKINSNMEDGWSYVSSDEALFPTW